jgi:hypothetical protein
MDIKSLEKLSTKRLLAFYKAERKRQQMPSYEDENYFHMDLKDIKKLLDDREHIEKKDVSKRVS